GRARDGIHDFSEWRLATEYAAYSGGHRGKKRKPWGGGEAEKTPEKRKPTRDRVRSAFVPCRCASIGDRKGRLHAVWAKEIPRRGKTRESRRFHCCSFCGIVFQFHLRCLGWFRQAAENLSR